MAMSVVYSNFGGMLVAETRGAEKRQYVSDPQGSLAAELDENQEVTYAATYWPFGEVATETGTKLSDWGYIGLLGYLKDLLNLLYVRARHLLPHKGRWLTVDPLWPLEPPYQYSDDPIAESDAMGLMSGPTCDNQLAFCLAQADQRYRSCLIKAVALCALATAMLITCVLLCFGNPVCIVMGCGVLRQAWYLACLVLPFACVMDRKAEYCECLSNYHKCKCLPGMFDLAGCITDCPGVTSFQEYLDCIGKRGVPSLT